MVGFRCQIVFTRNKIHALIFLQGESPVFVLHIFEYKHLLLVCGDMPPHVTIEPSCIHTGQIRLNFGRVPAHLARRLLGE